MAQRKKTGNKPTNTQNRKNVKKSRKTTPRPPPKDKAISDPGTLGAPGKKRKKK